MSRRFAIAFLTVAPLTFLAPKLAHAGIEACGNINVKASAQCKVEVKGGCTAKCETVSFKAACEGKLEVDCDAKCSVKAEASCTGSCKAKCSGDCTANPGSYDCKASCTGTCSGNCDAACEGQASGGTASGSCKAKCEANCSAKCEGDCSVTPPSATCDAKCDASCKGSCEAQVAVTCQGDCRATYEAPKCEAELKGGCKVNCEKPEGALFCDTEYVDTNDNLAKCSAALAAALNIKVDGSASAECSGNTCEAKAEGSISACSTTSEGQGHTPPLTPALIILGAIGAAIARRSRRDAA